MDTAQAIRTRRTHKLFTGEPVPRETLEALLELACWAPNHRMTEPWRFHVVTHDRIEALTAVVLGAITKDLPPKLQAKRGAVSERLPRLGAYIAVTREPAHDLRINREDYASCCCAVHNICLGATAQGLGSFWSTGAVFELPPVRAFLGISETAEVVASLWLGVPTRALESHRVPAAEQTTWV